MHCQIAAKPRQAAAWTVTPINNPNSHLPRNSPRLRHNQCILPDWRLFCNQPLPPGDRCRPHAEQIYRSQCRAPASLKIFKNKQILFAQIMQILWLALVESDIFGKYSQNSHHACRLERWHISEGVGIYCAHQPRCQVFFACHADSHTSRGRDNVRRGWRKCKFGVVHLDIRRDH